MPTAGIDERRRARAAKIEGLYAVTPDLADTADLCLRVAAAINGGARTFQYRNKQADAALARLQAIALGEVRRAHGGSTSSTTTRGSLRRSTPMESTSARTTAPSRPRGRSSDRNA